MKFTRCTSYLVTSCLLLFTMLVFAGDARAYQLLDALKSGLAYNYSARKDLNRVEEARLEKAKAFTGFLPTIGAAYQVQQNNPSDPALNESALGQIPSTISNGSLTIKQNLFNGGSDVAGYSAAHLTLLATKLEFYQSRRDLIAQIATLYQDVIFARERYKIQKQYMQTAEATLRDARVRFELGLVSKIDLMQAETEYYKAQYQEESMRAAMQNAESTFKFNVGIDPPQKMELIDVKKLKQPLEIKSFLKNVTKGNTLLKASRLKVLAAQKTVLQVGGSMLPNVTIAASKLSASPQDIIINPSFRGNQVTLAVNIPIFSGGAEYVAIKDARRNYREAKNNEKEQREKLINSSVQVWNVYTASKSQLPGTTLNVKQASETLQGMRISFDIGRKSMTDLLQAQNALLAAQLDLLENEKNYNNAIIQIHQLAGDIDKIYNLRS